MATQSRPSANALLQPQSRRRLSTLNFGMVFIIIGFVGAIVCAIAFGVTRMNAAPTDGMVSGGPVTQGASSTQELGMSGPSVDTAANPPASQPDTVVVQRSAEKPLAESTPTAAPTQSASASGSTSSADEASSERRETQRRAADEERQRLEQRQERADSAMRSLGSVTVAEQREGNAEAAALAPSTATMTQTTPREYAAPSGPILALDTAIPVALTHSIDSTFAGSISLPVMADVFDETGRTVLIPQGSTCFAKSAAGGVDGQDRIFVSVDLCKLPDRSRLVLDDFPVVDSDGATGVKARVDDHGAGRRSRGSMFAGLPGMLAGTVIPGGGIGESVAMDAASSAQQSQAGRAIPGPTLYVDASPQKPKTLSILVTQDTPIGVHPSEVSQ